MRPAARPLAILIAASMIVGCGSEAHSPTASSLRTQGLTTQVPRAITAACARAATTYHGTVSCPPLVPVGPAKVNEYVLNRSLGQRHHSYLLEIMSPSLMRLHGHRLAAAGGHWTVAAGTDPSLRSLVQAPNARERPQHQTAQVAGTPVDIYRMPSYEDGGGLYGGHVVIAWTHRGTAYQVSMHDYDNQARALDVTQAIVRQQR